MGRAEYINDDDVVINLSEFKNSSNNQRKITFPFYLSIFHNSDMRSKHFGSVEAVCLFYVVDFCFSLTQQEEFRCAFWAWSM